MRIGRKKKTTITDDILEMALHGYQHSLETIDQRISEIKKMIGGGGRAIAKAVESVNTPRKRRKLSAKARRAISQAQKKRWSDAKKAAAGTIKAAKKQVKRTIKAVKGKQ